MIWDNFLHQAKNIQAQGFRVFQQAIRTVF